MLEKLQTPNGGTRQQNTPLNFMKIKTLKTFLLIFAYFFVSGCFQNDEKLIMKCADIKFDKYLGTYYEGKVTSSELLFNKNLEKRFKSSPTYVKLYRICEYEFNTSPKTFKQLYK